MNFRRVLTALTLIAMFAALASAQLETSQNLTCSASAATSPSIRTEGIAELVGDVLITCTGGPNQTTSAADLGKVNITVDYAAPVTSKPIGAADVDGNQGVEAVLLVDEPTKAGGPFAAYTLCIFGGACPANVFAAGPPETFTGPNTFQGYIPAGKPNQIVFANIPVVTLGSTSFQHIFRVSNARVTPTSADVVATVTAVPVTGTNLGLALDPKTATVARPTQGLGATVSTIGLSLCNTTDLSGDKGSPNMALLTFTEKFNGAFKSRLIPASGDPADQKAVSGVYGTVSKDMSESGTNVGLPNGPSFAGIADSATRLKAVFTGLDKNATYYVSLNNVGDFSTTAATIRATLLPQTAPLETQPTGVYAKAAGTQAWGAIDVVALTVTNGSAEAVWEINNPDYKNAESLAFGVYAVYNTVTPPATSAAQKIQLGFAPTITSTAADAANTWVPRFSAPPAAVAGSPILLCQTSLLFPYVTNIAGWQTGIAISNTGKDPLGTVGSAGTCDLSFYGSNASTTPFAVASLDPGATYTNTLSGMGLTNFSGYMVGVCNFKYAHGFAFISDPAGSMAQGYLALVMNGNGRGTTLIGEAFGQ